LGGADTAATISGQLDLRSAAPSITTLDTAASSTTNLNSADLDIQGNVTATGNITYAGTGTVAYTGGSRIIESGTTTVNEGTLLLNKTVGPQIIGALTIGDDVGGQDADTVRIGSAALAIADPIMSHLNVVLKSTGQLDLNGVNQTLTGTNFGQTGTL